MTSSKQLTKDADAWRLHQAREMIRALRVKVNGEWISAYAENQDGSFVSNVPEGTQVEEAASDDEIN